jgi:hypothetical protein
LSLISGLKISCIIIQMYPEMSHVFKLYGELYLSGSLELCATSVLEALQSYLTCDSMR